MQHQTLTTLDGPSMPRRWSLYGKPPKEFCFGPPWTNEQIQALSRLDDDALIELFTYEWIIANDVSRLDTYGGYPAQYDIVGEHIVVADTDHDRAPNLDIYAITEARAWMHRAIDWLTRLYESDRDEADDWLLNDILFEIE